MAFELGTDGPDVVLARFDGSPTPWRAVAVVVGASAQAGHRLVGSPAVRAGRWPVAVVP